MIFRVNYPIKGIPNLGFLGSGKEVAKKVLLIDSGGNFTEYKSAQSAAAALNTNRSHVHKCLNGKIPHVKGYAAAYADDFLVDACGELKYNLEEIKKCGQEKLSGSRTNRSLFDKKIVAFAVNDLQPKIFNNMQEAENHLYCVRQSLTKCADGEAYTCAGHVVLWADDILDERGNIDIEKGKRLAQERLNLKFETPPDSQRRRIGGKKLVSYTEDLQPEIFRNLFEVENKLNCDRQSLTNCADGKSYTCGRRVFFWADDLLDEKGNINLEKGKNLAKKRFEQKHIDLVRRIGEKRPEIIEMYKKSVIAYDEKTLDYEKIGIINEFCEANPLYSRRFIAKSALGESCTYQGKVYVFEDDMTEYDSKGNKIINIEKGRQIAKERIKTKKNNLCKNIKKEISS